MTVLRIEHPITDFAIWQAAFARFEGARQEAGVLGHRIHRPVDDPNYVLIDLDFDEVGKAEAFLAFLRAQVWASTETSPGLAGVPHTHILNLEESLQPPGLPGQNASA